MKISGRRPERAAGGFLDRCFDSRLPLSPVIWRQALWISLKEGKLECSYCLSYSQRFFVRCDACSLCAHRLNDDVIWQGHSGWALSHVDYLLFIRQCYLVTCFHQTLGPLNLPLSTMSTKFYFESEQSILFFITFLSPFLKNGINVWLNTVELFKRTE